jgi:ankyrin repeat protein
VNNKNENELIIASKINQVKVVEILLERGIYIDHQDNFGNMALHYAVDIQEPYLIYKLMSKKSNVHLKNNEGKSALDLAKEIKGENKNEIIDLLSKPPYKLKKSKI